MDKPEIIIESIEKAITSEVCQTCAKCCRSFSLWMNDIDGVPDRIMLLSESSILVRKTDLKYPYSSYLVTINKECKELCSVDGAYKCDIWGDARRPELCKVFPMNLFDWMPNEIDDQEFFKYYMLCVDLCPALPAIGEIKRIVSINR